MMSYLLLHQHFLKTLNKMLKTVIEYFNWESFQIKSDLLLKDDFRLNAEFYEKNINISIDDNVEFKPLLEYASVLFPGIFKRILVNNEKQGIGFLTTSEMMMIEPVPEKFLSIGLTQNLDIYRVKDNTLLVSRSGTIGNTIYVNKDLIQYAITEDALRVVPFDFKKIGLLYFYFLSEYGNGLITGKKSGAVIDHIYEDDLSRIPIPVFDSKIEEYFYNTFISVKENRENANVLLKKARSLVLNYNYLPPLHETEIEYLNSENEVEIRKVKTDEFTSEFRLDAHFYNSVAKMAVDNISQFSEKSVQLIQNEITKKVFYLNRFTRTFVNEEHGIPYLAGKDIIKIRPTDISYLSKSETYGLNDYKLEKGWILMTCSGTLGRTCYIWNNYENWVGTHDLIRIVTSDEFDSGYLYAFLSSPYGYYQVLRYKHGAVVDHITPEQISTIKIPLPDYAKIKEIGDLVRRAFDFRADAIRLEDEAKEKLTKALTGI